MHRQFSVGVALAAAVGAAHAQETQTTVGSGAVYTTGRYGESQTTNMVVVPFTLRRETPSWIFRGLASYMRITGPSNVVGAGDGTITLPGGGAARRSETGFGDVLASAFYKLLQGDAGLDIGGKVKLATADENKGLGTGKNDYAVQADGYAPLGPATVFGTVGYRWYGDPPGFELRDVPYGAIGAAFRRSSATSFGAVYDFRPPISPGGARVSEATAYVAQRLSGPWKLQAYGIKGFSDASPDWGLGFTITYTH